MLPGTCVLCVNDESAIWLTTELILKAAGCDVVATTDVRRAMRLLSGVAIDLVVLDNVPGKEWLIRYIHRERRATRILLCSELAERDLDVDLILRKPVAPTELVQAVAALTALRAA